MVERQQNRPCCEDLKVKTEKLAMARLGGAVHPTGAAVGDWYERSVVQPMVL